MEYGLISCAQRESWLVPSEHGPSGSATPALEHAPALGHVSSRVRLLTAGGLAMHSQGCYQICPPGPLDTWDCVAERLQTCSEHAQVVRRPSSEHFCKDAL